MESNNNINAKDNGDSTLDPLQFGKWESLYPLQVGEIKIGLEHAALLPTGKVLFMSDEPYTLLWNPENEYNRDFELLPNSETGLESNLVCGGHSFLSNGHLLMLGGGGLDPYDAIRRAWRFNPFILKWTLVPADPSKNRMKYRRWYPTCLTLSDRKILIAGGEIEEGGNMEIYDESTDSFSLITTSGEKKYFPQTYPGLNLLPGGEVFYTPTGFGDWMQMAENYVDFESSGYFKFTSPNSGQWTDTGKNIRIKGMQAILLQDQDPTVRIIVFGGGTPEQSKTAQIINLSILPSTWIEPTLKLNEARVHPNVVLLPDNTVFICGGLTDQGFPYRGGICELYDPKTNNISKMASLNYPRHYHSIALLLPNGKVLAAGGSADSGGTESLNNPIEIYSPPYLFKGPRPVIITIQSTGRITMGSTVKITTPEKNISSVVLVRPMAVTHQTDTEQRVIPLNFTIDDNFTLTASIPDGKPPIGVLPKGYYMLFILNDNGVPSTARFININ